jgi:hypothetical protein
MARFMEQAAIVPWWSDHIKTRKLPIILGSVIQLLSFLALVYISNVGATVRCC